MMKKIITVFILLLILCIPTTSLQEEFEEMISLKEDEKKPIEGTIEIPKIKLKQIFRENSNVDKSITVLSPSQYPEEVDSLLILAGHSGTGLQSYFNNLYQLEKSDPINIIHNDHHYTYKIVDIYVQPKTGTAMIYKVKNKKTLVLVTCTNQDPNTQTFYIAVC